MPEPLTKCPSCTNGSFMDLPREAGPSRWPGHEAHDEPKTLCTKCGGWFSAAAIAQSVRVPFDPESPVVAERYDHLHGLGLV